MCMYIYICTYTQQNGSKRGLYDQRWRKWRPSIDSGQRHDDLTGNDDWGGPGPNISDFKRGKWAYPQTKIAMENLHSK